MFNEETKEIMFCPAQEESQIKLGEESNEMEVDYEPRSNNKNEVLLLFDEPNKDISNRIKVAKNTPNKFIPLDQLLNGMTPKLHRSRKGIKSALKRTLLFEDSRTPSRIETPQRTPSKLESLKQMFVACTPISEAKSELREVPEKEETPLPIPEDLPVAPTEVPEVVEPVAEQKSEQPMDIEKEYDERQMYSQKMSEYDEDMLSEENASVPK